MRTCVTRLDIPAGSLGWVQDINPAMQRRGITVSFPEGTAFYSADQLELTDAPPQANGPRFRFSRQEEGLEEAPVTGLLETETAAERLILAFVGAAAGYLLGHLVVWAWRVW